MTQKNDYIEPKKELNLCRKLSDNTNNVVLLIGGNPWINNFNYEIIIFLPKSVLYSKSKAWSNKRFNRRR